MKKIPHGFSTVISPLFTGRLEAARPAGKFQFVSVLTKADAFHTDK